jgi:hypothetical protein
LTDFLHILHADFNGEQLYRILLKQIGQSYTKQKIYVERKTERDGENNDKFKLSVKETVKWRFYNASDILKMSKNWMKNNEPVRRLIYLYLLY